MLRPESILTMRSRLQILLALLLTIGTTMATAGASAEQDAMMTALDDNTTEQAISQVPTGTPTAAAVHNHRRYARVSDLRSSRCPMEPGHFMHSVCNGRHNA